MTIEAMAMLIISCTFGIASGVAILWAIFGKDAVLFACDWWRRVIKDMFTD